MSSPVRVGVVVPAYQAQRWLDETLASVCGQTLTSWVCVVVDDGSTDGTAATATAWAAREPRICVLSQANRGISGARNAGLAALPDVDVVAFLDSDDTWSPDALAQLVDALAARPDASGAYGLAELVDAAGAPLRPGAHPARQRARRRHRGGPWWGHLEAVAPTADLTADELVVDNPFWPPATGVVRRTALAAAGPFDESYRVQEDWHLWLRVVEQGPLLALDRVLARYRQHGSNLTGDDGANVTAQARLRAEIAARAAGSDRAVGAWRVLHAHRVWHAASLLSRGLRRRDPALAGLAALVLAATVPQLALPRPPRPGPVTRGVLALERRAGARA